jgi:hypothetical protein
MILLGNVVVTGFFSRTARVTAGNLAQIGALRMGTGRLFLLRSKNWDLRTKTYEMYSGVICAAARRLLELRTNITSPEIFAEYIPNQVLRARTGESASPKSYHPTVAA